MQILLSQQLQQKRDCDKSLDEDGCGLSFSYNVGLEKNDYSTSKVTTQILQNTTEV
ncbi:hypothetical protein MA16_Dca027939 [Dendrobium catenatum]|uniref:Uncharacterized protein n=1 Tax=Dendrobium catenatum TaxID=906689 RepID=A0A2I0VFJ1_9ASPA|nr:hypothetical protein MA16_Dca027939 [Dendrobium catenatum]